MSVPEGEQPICEYCGGIIHKGGQRCSAVAIAECHATPDPPPCPYCGDDTPDHNGGGQRQVGEIIYTRVEFNCPSCEGRFWLTTECDSEFSEQQEVTENG